MLEELGTNPLLITDAGQPGQCVEEGLHAKQLFYSEVGGGCEMFTGEWFFF